MHLVMKQLFKLTPFLIGVTLVAGMLVFVSLNRAFTYQELVALDLVPKPEKFTELYFNDNTSLPASATSNQSIRFAFAIHNLEAADYQYTYDVVVDAHGTRYIVDRGDVLVKNNQYYVKTEQFKLPNLPGRQEVIVELTNKQQSIDFWIGR